MAAHRGREAAALPSRPGGCVRAPGVPDRGRPRRHRSGRSARPGSTSRCSGPPATRTTTESQERRPATGSVADTGRVAGCALTQPGPVISGTGVRASAAGSRCRGQRSRLPVRAYGLCRHVGYAAVGPGHADPTGGSKCSAIATSRWLTCTCVRPPDREEGAVMASTPTPLVICDRGDCPAQRNAWS